MLRKLAWLITALAVLVVYAQVLEAPFFWDDRALIVESTRLDLGRLGELFGEAFWSQQEAGDVRVYYRPLTLLSFAVDKALHGSNPAGYHLTNVALHVAASLCLLALLRRYRAGVVGSLLAALGWALHPRLTEAVAWISGRTDVLAGLFVLAALVVQRPGRLGRSALAAVLLALGLLSKESALAGVVAVTTLELWPRHGVPLAARARGAAPPLLALGLYWALRSVALGGAPPASEPPLVLTGLERASASFGAVGYYASMLLVPWTPRLQLGELWDVPRGYVLAGLAVVTGLVALGLRHRRRCRRAGWGLVAGLALAGTSWLLVLHLVRIPIQVVAADRFLYLPLAGLALAMGRHLRRPRRTAHRWQLALGLLLLSFVGATWLRVSDTTSEVRLWTKTYRQVSPTNPLPATELGNVYFRAGLYAEATELYRAATEHAAARSQRWTLLSNYGNGLDALGRYEEAQAVLDPLCHSTQLAKPCLDAGLTALHRLDLESAERLLQRALARSPGYPDAVAALERVQRVQEARQRATEASGAPSERLAQDFELLSWSGRRLEALRLADASLRAPETPAALRLAMLEYWVRFGHPLELEGKLTAWGEVPPALAGLAAERARIARELQASWTQP